ncbi:hypothetical protein OFN54_36335, partial [Escherichia coli]|nr:hypothetical protein [Escherichia coli]
TRMRPLANNKFDFVTSNHRLINCILPSGSPHERNGVAVGELDLDRWIIESISTEEAKTVE